VVVVSLWCVPSSSWFFVLSPECLGKKMELGKRREDTYGGKIMRRTIRGLEVFYIPVFCVT